MHFGNGCNNGIENNVACFARFSISGRISNYIKCTINWRVDEYFISNMKFNLLSNVRVCVDLVFATEKWLKN